jgi:4-amino-4-deoxy-L-arabinose transferase-like glycosyltransferase
MSLSASPIASLPGASARRLAGLPAWLWAAAYFASVALLQLAVSSTAELDQAEQLVLSQTLAWGYTNQPPLYTWLVWALFQLTGPSLLALSALKVALLTALVAGCAGTCRALGLDAPRARLALWGVLLLPPIVWEAQRDLTHSLLAAALGAVFLAQVLGLLRRAAPVLAGPAAGPVGSASARPGPAWLAYALAGALAGACVLAKHNAAVLVAALALAVLLTPPWRARLQPAGVALAAVVAAGVVLPHALWLLAHQAALQQTVDKLASDAGGGALDHLLGLLPDLLRGLLGFAGTLLLAAPLLLRGPVAAWRRVVVKRRAKAMKVAPGEAQADPSRASTPAADALAASAPALLGRLIACAVALLAALAWSMGADAFKSRWFLPVLFVLPLWLTARSPVAGGWRARAFAGTAVAVALLCAVLLPLQVLRPLPGQPEVRRNLPLVELGHALAQAVPDRPAVLLAPSHLLAGNLRLAWPHTEVRAASLRLAAPQAALAGSVLIVCPPQDLGTPGWADWLQRQAGWRVQDVRWQGVVEVPVLHRPARPAHRLLWARVPVRVPASGPAPVSAQPTTPERRP